MVTPFLRKKPFFTHPDLPTSFKCMTPSFSYHYSHVSLSLLVLHDHRILLPTHMLSDVLAVAVIPHSALFYFFLTPISVFTSLIDKQTRLFGPIPSPAYSFSSFLLFPPIYLCDGPISF